MSFWIDEDGQQYHAPSTKRQVEEWNQGIIYMKVELHWKMRVGRVTETTPSGCISAREFYWRITYYTSITHESLAKGPSII